MKTFIAVLLLFVSAQASAEVRSCSTLQKALYSKPTLEIRMVFGYKDARPARFVGDRHERLAFIEHITAPCGADEQACGFIRSRENADLFTKTVTIADQLKTVRLMVVNSSVGTDDEENQSDPFQAWKSKYAQKTFLNGLKEADVVFYNGHSRFGGGPDFFSPDLASDGTVDASRYKNRRTGIKKLLTALEESKRPKSPPFSQLKVLGLFSCTSSQHFNNQIKKVSDAGLLSSAQLMYYSDALDQSLSAIDSVLNRQCPKSLIL
jgi:hypothetical protein